MFSAPTPQTPPEDLLKRLALCQFLFSEAQRCLRQPDQYSPGVATSLTQDTVEAFLRCLAEHCKIPLEKNETFHSLVRKVGKKYEQILGHSAALTRLNEARVSFKHFGNNVAREDALAFQNNVSSFLNEISQEVLEVDFSAVSLVDAIGHDQTKDLLREAEVALHVEDYVRAVEFSARAAHTYLKYRATLVDRNEGYLDGIAIGDDVLQSQHFEFGIHDEIIEALGPLVARNLETTEALLMLLARGVDVASFYRFQAIAPKTFQSQSGGIDQVWLLGKRQHLSRDDAQFCIRFVIDFALQLRRTSVSKLV